MVTISNVHFGGTLNQHIFHETSIKSRQELVHDLYWSRNDAKIKLKNNKVNSLHHQSINELGNGLISICEAQDGHIEVIKHAELPIAAVQYHPEEIWDNLSQTLINNLLNINENE